MTDADVRAPHKPDGRLPAKSIPGAPTELDYLAQIHGMLGIIAARQIGAEGVEPNFKLREFALVAGARTVVSHDWKPDRWVVWITTITDGLLRIWPGGWAPSDEAVQIESGQRAIVPAVNEQLAFHNPSASVDVTVFAVAIGGGLEFDIAAI
jgi:hypothetical protein